MCEHCRTYLSSVSGSTGFDSNGNPLTNVNLNNPPPGFGVSGHHQKHPSFVNEFGSNTGTAGSNALTDALNFIPNTGANINKHINSALDSGGKAVNVFQHDIQNIQDAFGKNFANVEKYMPWILLGLFGVGLWFLAKKV